MSIIPYRLIRYVLEVYLLRNLTLLSVFLNDNALLEVQVLVSGTVTFVLDVLMTLRLLTLGARLYRFVLTLRSRYDGFLTLITMEVVLRNVLHYGSTDLVVITTVNTITRMDARVRMRTYALVLLLCRRVLRNGRAINYLDLRVDVQRRVRGLLRNYGHDVDDALIRSELQDVLVRTFTRGMLHRLYVLSLQVTNVVFLRVL